MNTMHVFAWSCTLVSHVPPNALSIYCTQRVNVQSRTTIRYVYPLPLPCPSRMAVAVEKTFVAFGGAERNGAANAIDAMRLPLMS